MTKIHINIPFDVGTKSTHLRRNFIRLFKSLGYTYEITEELYKRSFSEQAWNKVTATRAPEHDWIFEWIVDSVFHFDFEFRSHPKYKQMFEQLHPDNQAEVPSPNES